MPRIRTIKPEFTQSESIGRLSRDARLLFIQLWTLVDDSSRARASSRLLASLLYPYDDDAGGLMDGWLSELEAGGFVRRYRVDGTTYLDIPKWLKHQKIDRPSPSRLPEFDEPSTSPRESSRSLDAGPRTVDLGSRTKDRTTVASRRRGAKPAEVLDVGILVFPTVGTKAQQWPLTQAHLEEWTALYPGLDVLAECRKALAWVQSNDLKRKTPGGMKTFLVKWFNRSTDSPRATGPHPYSKTAGNKDAAKAFLEGRLND